MKLNQWTIALAAAGVVSLGSVAQAEEAQQHQVLTALSSTTLSGYVDTSAIWKFGTGNANMPGRSYDGAGKQDGFNLDVIKVSLEKPLDEGQWSAGYKVDLLAGPDAATFNAFTPGGGFAANLAIEQAYVNLRAPVGNGLDFKLGVFDSLFGYESFDAYKNPNFSRSYGYAIDPKQHTGGVASYRLADWISVAGGVSDTYNGGINARPVRGTPFGGFVPAVESEKSYMGLLNLTAPESAGALKGASLYAGVVKGLNGAAPASATDVTSYYVGATIPLPITGLAVGGSYDYRGNTATTKNGAYIPSMYANAVAGYLSYQATEKLKLNNRLEYASGSGGTWGTALKAEEFFAETFTVDYSLWANVVSRVEFRWDRDLKGGPPVFGGGPATLYAPRDRNALSLALNIIYKF